MLIRMRCLTVAWMILAAAALTGQPACGQEAQFKTGDRLCLLNQGRMHASAEKEAFRTLDDPVVQQFIHGRAQGPIQFL